MMQGVQKLGIELARLIAREDSTSPGAAVFS